MKWLPAPVGIFMGLLLVSALTNDRGWDYAAIGFAIGWVYAAAPAIWALLSRAERS